MSKNKDKRSNLSSERFTIPTDLVIKNEEWFGGGDAEITRAVSEVSGECVMYQMVCVVGKAEVVKDVGEYKNFQLVLKNTKGDVVLIVKELVTIGSVTMELLLPYSTTNQDYTKATPLARVSRKFGTMTIHSRYEIELLEYALKQYDYENIDCVGHWPKTITFKTRKSEKELAIGSRNIRNNWSLSVAAGEDVLLFVGIACAIDRICYGFKQNHF